jgi:hypothetical protein
MDKTLGLITSTEKKKERERERRRKGGEKTTMSVLGGHLPQGQNTKSNYIPDTSNKQIEMQITLFTIA